MAGEFTSLMVNEPASPHCIKILKFSDFGNFRSNFTLKILNLEIVNLVLAAGQNFDF